jgi:hypothetical protein
LIGKGGSPFDAIRHGESDGTEWWSARELMPHIGYSKWDSFKDVIERAKAACRNCGQLIDDNFKSCSFAAPRGNRGASPLAEDVQLSRYGCYLSAMNGDPRKTEIAAAQTYFAIQTRRAESELPPINKGPVVIQTGNVLQHRPWYERLEKTLRDHRKWIIKNLPSGSFSVLTGVWWEMIVIEDILIDHLLPLKGSDLADGSIGRRWAEYRRERSMKEPDMTAPLWLPDRDIEVNVKVYSSDEHFSFQDWLNNEYLPEHLPDYLVQHPIKRGTIISCGQSDGSLALGHDFRH